MRGRLKLFILFTLIYPLSSNLAIVENNPRYLLSIKTIIPVVNGALISNVCNPKDYGAKADGITDDSQAIQSAINKCENDNGGAVLLSKGTYLSGPLVLKSNVYLKIEADAILKALPYELYPDTSRPKNFITANHASNIGILGKGIINGNGSEWWIKVNDIKGNQDEINSPKLLSFSDCKNIILEDIKLINSPSFHFVSYSCKNILIRGITIDAPASSLNTDGIEVNQSQNIFIKNCTIATGNDNIAIRAEKGSANNIYIADCLFLSGHGLLIESKTNFKVNGVYVMNCSFNGTTNGIRIRPLQSSGGRVEKLYFLNTKMLNVDVVLEFLDSVQETKNPVKGTKNKVQTEGRTPLTIENIIIDSLRAANVKKAAGHILATLEKPFKNIKLINVNIFAEKGLEIRNSQVFTSDVTITVRSQPEFIFKENAKLTQIE